MKKTCFVSLYLGYSQSTSSPSNLYSRRKSMAWYTNWFMRKVLLVSSLKGVDPKAHPPIANRICELWIHVRQGNLKDV